MAGRGVPHAVDSATHGGHEEAESPDICSGALLRLPVTSSAALPVATDETMVDTERGEWA